MAYASKATLNLALAQLFAQEGLSLDVVSGGELYRALEAGMPPTMAKFYGMITNIDENLGGFRDRLKKLSLSENTLLIFMTDNGTTAGWIDMKSGYKYYNAGMRAVDISGELKGNLYAQGREIAHYMAYVPIVESAGGVITDWEGRRLDLASGADRIVAAGDAAAHTAALGVLAGRP